MREEFTAPAGPGGPEDRGVTDAESTPRPRSAARDESSAERDESSAEGGAKLARQALDQAKADVRRRGAGPSRDPARGSRPAASRGSGRVTGRDPLSLSGAIEELLTDRGWRAQATVATVFARWPELVGTELAAHTRPDSLDGGELVVVADSAAWATQVRLLSSTLVRRLCEQLGDGTVHRVRVHGPGRRRGHGGGPGTSGGRGS